MNKLKVNMRWGYVSQVLNSGINIILLPFVTYFLSSQELGLWYTFAAIGSFILLLDFGFSNTMVRNVGYAWSGASSIHHNKIEYTKENSKVNLILFTQIFYAGKKIYLYLSIVAFLLLFTLGTLYIENISQGVLNFRDSTLPWFIYSITVVINIYYLYWTPVLKGARLIKQYYQVNTISKVIQLILSVLLLVFGFGLLGVSLAYLASVLCGRILSKKMFYNNNKVIFSSKELHKKSENKAILSILLPSIYKQGILSFSNYLIDKFPIILSSLMFGLNVTSQLGLTLQIMSVFSTMGNVAYNTFLPEMIKSNTMKDKRKSQELLFKSLSIQFILILFGSLFVLLFGEMILEIFKSNTKILPWSSLCILSLYILVFNFQLVCVNYIIIDNAFPMVRSYFVTSITMVICAWTLSFFFNSYGVNLILLSQLILLLSYNSWKWPLYISRKMNISLSEFIIKSTLNIKIIR